MRSLSMRLAAAALAALAAAFFLSGQVIKAPGSGPNAPTPPDIAMSRIIGLATELASRKPFGPTQATNRTVFLNEFGLLDTVLGDEGDCVRVDGTATPCGTGGGGGGGSVFSVFGRTGTVTAHTGDYQFSQIGGTAATGQLPSAAGDVQGAYSALSVRAIQGRCVSVTAPTDQQFLRWSGTSACWEPYTVTGGGGSSISFADHEVPTGTVNGVNAVFALARTPAPTSSLNLFRNGILQRAAADFNLSGSTVTFVTGGLPQPGDLLEANYRY